MTSLSTGFTTLQLNNRMSANGALPYDKCPGLMSGEVQRNCQSAFRQHMLTNTSVDDLLDSLMTMPTSDLDDREAVDIFIVNAAFALSAPCEDYDALYEYIHDMFDCLDIDLLRECQNTTRWILDTNPVNPYLAFKNSSIDHWGALNEIFSCGEKLLLLAVIFDDVQMAEKVSQSRFAGDFKRNLGEALAKTIFDPLSSVRCWAEMTNPSMVEVECRISRQARALQTYQNTTKPVAFELAGNLLYKITPEIGSQSEFSAGVYNLFALAAKSQDHMLRHIPRYFEFISHCPGIIEECLDAAISHKNPDLIPVLINDLRKAGIADCQILYKHIERNSYGEYLDKIDNKDILTQQYLEDLLSSSTLLKKEATRSYGVALQALLGFVDPALIDKYAKSDAQLQSAYSVTGNKKYLERMSEATTLDQLGADLGL